MNSTALSLLPNNYGYVALVASSTFFLHIYQATQVGRTRKAAKILYPQYMAEKSQMDANPAAVKFNCAQRAHANTLETLPQMIFGILFSGLEYPLASAAFGAVWVIGRVLYTYGYVTGKPEARMSYGGYAHVAGMLGILILSTFVSAKLVLSKF